MEEKIKDIRSAIDNRCFLSGLALALTLPDICGKVRYPREKYKGPYIKWVDEYVTPYYCHPDDKFEGIYKNTEFNGEVCYSLRCAYLHSGNIDLQEQNKDILINPFDLCISSNQDNSIYSEMQGVTTSDFSGEKKYSLRLDLRRLCNTLCDVAEKYYQKHENKKLFLEHTIHIINMDEEICKIHPNYKPLTIDDY